ITSSRENLALIAAIVAVLLMPAAEAGIYRLVLKARFWRALWLCAVLDLAAYGLSVLWLNYLPGGVNPWYARLILGEASGFSTGAAAIAAVLYAAAFAAVKVPALIWWLRHGGPDHGITITVLLTNLIVFFAISDVVAVLVGILS
ncbi:MAG: hypothetical protein ACOCX2_11930, partial [Armatimonadota bacterium]